MKILYVEDEEFLGRIVKETLESRGFTIAMETNGALVMQRFIDFNPDVCVLDIMLPDKSGFEIAAEIRKKNMEVPIIFLTAKTQAEDAVKGFKLGANDYMRKPFSIEELIARIENASRKSGSSSFNNDHILSIGNYTLNINKQLLELKEEQRKLSYRETELLKLLLERRNNIITRADVLLHIWGNDSLFNSRNLDVYITKLRSYLKDDANIEILTIKGVGYRFVC